MLVPTGVDTLHTVLSDSITSTAEPAASDGRSMLMLSPRPPVRQLHHSAPGVRRNRSNWRLCCAQARARTYREKDLSLYVKKWSLMDDINTYRSRFGLSELSIAGFGLTLSGFLGVMGIITAEVLYPNYSTRQDISDLGSTRPPPPTNPKPSPPSF